MSIQAGKILDVLILLMLANGAPLVAKQLLGDRRCYPLDGNLRFADGRRVFGPSKTVRGVILAVLATAAGAVILGLDWRVGAIIGSMAMAGDLFSSFIKRRLGMASRLCHGNERWAGREWSHSYVMLLRRRLAIALPLRL
jgi:hypothetical protein